MAAWDQGSVTAAIYGPGGSAMAATGDPSG